MSTTTQSPSSDATATPTVLTSSAPGQRAVATERTYIAAALLSRPLERKMAFTAVALAAVAALIMFGRELFYGSLELQFVATLTVACLGTAFAAAVAIPKEDQSFCPVWEPLVYLLIIASIVLVPLIGRWATIQGFGMTPAMLPSLAWFTCIIAPFAVANQSAFGLGSAVPKCIVMAAAVRFCTLGDWGLFGPQLLTTPHTAIVAMACFSMLCSFAMLLLKKTLPNGLMIGLGMILTFPGILLTERALIALQLA